MDIFEEIVALKKAGTPAVLATVVEALGSSPGKTSARMLIKADGSIMGTIGGGAIEKKMIDEAMTIMNGTESKLLKYSLEELGMACGGDMTVFLEPLERAPELIIFGAGHIGTALSNICKMLGFTTTVVDNRSEFANKERLPWADRIIADDYPKTLKELIFSHTTYLVIVTHRHVHDLEILDHCAKQPFRYLGMIGSRKKVTGSFQQLRERGIDEAILKRIHAPTGIAIGAKTPEEIAVSIAAELVAIRSGTEISSLKLD
ncbi:MAG: XdhC family protein [Thermodesulfobacteriota bacterium]